MLNDRTCLLEETGGTGGSRWRLRGVVRHALPGAAAGPYRTRGKWRDGALWLMAGGRIRRRDPDSGAWTLMADPGLEFMDFEVDMTGRILLVCTADPRTRTFRGLLEAVGPDGKGTRILAPYPDPGCQEWGKTLPPVAAASLQAGYESVQILEYTVLFNPLSRRVFVFRPLEDRLQEVRLGLPLRTYPDLARAEPLDDLCWQVLPRNTFGAWLVMDRKGPGLAALPLDLSEGTAGEPVSLPGLSLPVFPDADGALVPLGDALGTFGKKVKGPAGTSPLHPSPG